MKKKLALSLVLIGHSSFGAIVLDHSTWISLSDNQESFSTTSSSLATNQRHLIDEPLLLDSGVTLLPGDSTVLLMFEVTPHLPDPGLTGYVELNFNDEEEFSSPQSFSLLFPTPTTGISFFLGNVGTFYDDVVVSLRTPSNTDATSLGFFPEFRQEFIGFLSDEPFLNVEIRVDAVQFNGELGNTRLSFYNFSQSSSIPEPSGVLSLGALLGLGLMFRSRR